MSLSFHRKEQWDLGCHPLLCIHLRTVNASTRIFCLWDGGVAFRRTVWRWKRAHAGGTP